MRNAVGLDSRYCGAVVFRSGGQLAEILILFVDYGYDGGGVGGVGVACGSERFKLRPPEDQTT